MAETSIYIAPDIRRQTLEEAEAFLAAKRLRRMVVILNARQKIAEKSKKVQGVEADRFAKRVEKVNAAERAVNEALTKLENAINAALATSNTLNNIEQGLMDL